MSRLTGPRGPGGGITCTRSYGIINNFISSYTINNSIRTISHNISNINITNDNSAKSTTVQLDKALSNWTCNVYYR